LSATVPTEELEGEVRNLKVEDNGLHVDFKRGVEWGWVVWGLGSSGREPA
jgi:hypothetical protein